MLELPLPTTKEDFQNKKLKNLSKMLKNTNNKMKRSKEKLKLKMVYKATASTSNTQSMTRNFKERSANKTREQL